MKTKDIMQCILVFVLLLYLHPCVLFLCRRMPPVRMKLMPGQSIEEKIMEEQIEADEVDLLEKELKKYKDEKIDEILPGYDPEK